MIKSNLGEVLPVSSLLIHSFSLLLNHCVDRLPRSRGLQTGSDLWEGRHEKGEVSGRLDKVKLL